MLWNYIYLIKYKNDCIYEQEKCENLNAEAEVSV